MKHGLIITGGALDLGFAGAFLAKNHFDVVVAADAGLAAAKSLGIVPYEAVGDFDTLDPAVFQEYRRMEQMEWEIHKPEKNESDTELAVWTAIRLGCDRLTVLGALGSRFDHTLSNVQLLKQCLDRGVDACLVDRQNRITLIDGERTFVRSQTYGTYISFLPMTMEVRGVTLTGFQYPLTDRDVFLGNSLCISNELTEETGRITFREGLMLCVEAKD